MCTSLWSNHWDQFSPRFSDAVLLLVWTWPNNACPGRLPYSVQEQTWMLKCTQRHTGWAVSTKQGKVTDPCFRMATVTSRGDIIYTHPGTHTQNRAPTPTELKTFIWQHQLTPDTHTLVPWPCSTSRLIKIVAGIRGVGTTGRESHSFCALCVCFSIFVCVCVSSQVDETSQRLREGRSGEALTLSILHYWLVSRKTVLSGQRQIE